MPKPITTTEAAYCAGFKAALGFLQTLLDMGRTLEPSLRVYAAAMVPVTCWRASPEHARDEELGRPPTLAWLLSLPMTRKLDCADGGEIYDIGGLYVVPRENADPDSCPRWAGVPHELQPRTRREALWLLKRYGAIASGDTNKPERDGDKPERDADTPDRGEAGRMGYSMDELRQAMDELLLDADALDPELDELFARFGAGREEPTKEPT